MKATIQFDNKILEAHLNKSTIVDELYVMFTLEQTATYARLKLDVHPKQDILLQSIDIQLDTPLDKIHDRLFCNGFQTWSESRLYHFNEIPDGLKWFAKPLMGYYGDYHFDFIPRKKGILHSWSYSYIDNNNSGTIQFIGSLNDHTGFTCLLYDADNQRVTIKKDVENLHLAHSFPAIDVLIMKGSESAVFDTYFDLQKIKIPQQQPATGWTSWYNYYTNISEKIIVDNLNAFKEKDISIDYFQIDDGWETCVGDWLSVKESFPNGLAKMAQLIHNQGFKASLWLAPFIVEPKSYIFQNKPDWVLKGKDNKPLKVGMAPHWSGWRQPFFYALDFYNKEVQEYLTGVFHTVLQKWGFDMVKLDFLYAVCVMPRPNKTRGQIMHDAMAFLRHVVGNKILLGCGVPLASAFGLVDYCRIGADIHLSWEHKFLKFLKNRERMSTIVALRTTLGRWQLNGRAFQSDPDVFILREKNQQLTQHQRHTVFIIHVLLGNLLFCSDKIDDYTRLDGRQAEGGELDEYKTMFQYLNRKIINVKNHDDDFYTILFEFEGVTKRVYCNLSSKSVVIEGLNIEAFQSVETTL